MSRRVQDRKEVWDETQHHSGKLGGGCVGQNQMEDGERVFKDIDQKNTSVFMRDPPSP